MSGNTRERLLKILELRDVQKKTFKEIGEVLDIHLSLVNAIYRKAKRQESNLHYWLYDLPPRVRNCLMFWYEPSVSIEDLTKALVIEDLAAGKLNKVPSMGTKGLQILKNYFGLTKADFPVGSQLTASYVGFDSIGTKSIVDGGELSHKGVNLKGRWRVVGEMVVKLVRVD